MNSAINQFEISIDRVRDLIAIYQSLNAQSTNALDLSDILRAALVLAVSALDFYIHEVVRIGMLEIHLGNRPEPVPNRNTSSSAYSRFSVSLGNASEDRKLAINMSSWILNDLAQSHGSDFIQQNHSTSTIVSAISNCIENRITNASWLENEIRERHSYLSFQQPEKIADAIRLISNKKLWKEVGTLMNKSDTDVKQELSVIVDRRNKIAHEADIDPSYNLAERWNIDESLVNNAVSFIEQLVNAIHQTII